MTIVIVMVTQVDSRGCVASGHNRRGDWSTGTGDSEVTPFHLAAGSGHMELGSPHWILIAGRISKDHISPNNMGKSIIFSEMRKIFISM